MANNYTKAFNDPNYEVITSNTLGNKTYSLTEQFPTEVEADNYLTELKAALQAELDSHTARVAVLTTEISNIDVALGV
jgi:hypothetical protein